MALELFAGVLGHFWRSQCGISVRNGSIGVGLLDRSILCRILVFSGVVRPPIAIQTCRTGVSGLVYSPLPLLDGEGFISEVDCGDWMAFCGQYPRKGLHIPRRECAWHTSIWSLSSTTQHAQNVKIWSYCTFCAVTAWKRPLKRRLLWGRKNKENTRNENGLVLVYILALFIRSLLCASGCYCTNRRGSLSATVCITVNTNWVCLTSTTLFSLPGAASVFCLSHMKECSLSHRPSTDCFQYHVFPTLVRPQFFCFSLGASPAHNAGGRVLPLFSQQIFFTKVDKRDGKMIVTHLPL